MRTVVRDALRLSLCLSAWEEGGGRGEEGGDTRQWGKEGEGGLHPDP